MSKDIVDVLATFDGVDLALEDVRRLTPELIQVTSAYKDSKDPIVQEFISILEGFLSLVQRIEILSQKLKANIGVEI